MNEKWDRRFLEMARLVSTWSKDPSTKIGVVLVKDRKVVATGYNGFPTGVADDERLHEREEKYALIVHAEMNAILQAGHDAEGSTLYLWGFTGPPCRGCTKHVIQAGIKRVVVNGGNPPPDRWKAELDAAYATYEEVGVPMDVVEID